MCSDALPGIERPARALRWPRSIIVTIQAEDAPAGVLRVCRVRPWLGPIPATGRGRGSRGIFGFDGFSECWGADDEVLGPIQQTVQRPSAVGR